MDHTYVVKRFQTLVNGDIRRCPDETPAAKKGRCRNKYATATLKAMKAKARTDMGVKAGQVSRFTPEPRHFSTQPA